MIQKCPHPPQAVLEPTSLPSLKASSALRARASPRGSVRACADPQLPQAPRTDRNDANTSHAEASASAAAPPCWLPARPRVRAPAHSPCSGRNVPHATDLDRNSITQACFPHSFLFLLLNPVWTPFLSASMHPPTGTHHPHTQGCPSGDKLAYAQGKSKCCRDPSPPPSSPPR